ncbi:MAG: 2-hydroxyacyl-CoA dehydratase family protein [Clostridiales bacterium]|nr:2-hydroxyacyl-CoA dehydratase family protein [Clostridiales bacterium]
MKLPDRLTASENEDSTNNKRFGSDSKLKTQNSKLGLQGSPIVGITTTIPVEIVFAAGYIPSDLNNLFITAEENTMNRALQAAEMEGYPRTVCGWIKGIYGLVAGNHLIKRLIAVTEGDCSQTHALMETLEERGIDVIPFSYPFSREPQLIKYQLAALADRFGIDLAAAEAEKKRLDEVRRLVREIDRLTYEENLVGGYDNHLFQVSCSDFEGNPESFAQKAEKFIAESRGAGRRQAGPRLAYIGVPPIITNLFHIVQELKGNIFFNEVQRQFAMPYLAKDLTEQYLLYTYPYHIRHRIADIQEQIARRQIDGIIHYCQSFCFRQIEDILFRRHLKLPLLTIEGENPGPMDARTKMRLETFVTMLKTTVRS